MEKLGDVCARVNRMRAEADKADVDLLRNSDDSYCRACVGWYEEAVTHKHLKNVAYELAGILSREKVNREDFDCVMDYLKGAIFDAPLIFKGQAGSGISPVSKKSL